MKKLFLILTLPLFLLAQQEQDYAKMYQQLTGKTLDQDMIDNYMQKKNGTQTTKKTTANNQKNNDNNKSNLQDSVKTITSEQLSDSTKGTYFEKYVKNEVIDPYNVDLKQYSIDFASINSSLDQASLSNKKVPDNYYLNIGDVIVVDIWGAISKTYELEFNNAGYVIIPDIGRIDLGGLSYGQVRSVIAQKLSLITGIKFAIRIKEVKSINIYVVGNVQKPGIYNVNPFMGVIEVLALAGGIEPSGSYRNIKITGSSKKSKFVDLYRTLFEGQRDDTVLENDMLIFVPLVDKQIAISGNVKKEGIYEYKSGEKLNDVLTFSGTAPFADLDRIEVERIGKDKKGKVISTSLSANPTLNDGDIIRIFSTMVYQQNYVYLKGNFRHNKKIEYKSGLKLKDIINNLDLLKDDTNLTYGQIIRQNSTGDKLFSITFSPSAVIKNEANAEIEVSSRDTIQLFSLNETTSDNFVKIQGEVKNPGLYRFSQDMTARDLIYAAGGYDYKARKDTIEVAIPILNGSKSAELSLVSDADLSNLKLQPNTFIFVRSIPDFVRSNLVKINGRIKFPGDYMINQGEKLSEIIRRAGGSTDNAHLNGIRIFRKSVKDQQEEKIQKLKNELKNKLAALALSQKSVAVGLDLDFYDSIKVGGRVIIDPKNNDISTFTLQDGDSVYIPALTNTVLVMGEVIQETAISYNKNEKKPKFYIKKSGGITDFADENNIHIIKANGEVLRDEGWFANVDNYEVEAGDLVFVPYDYTKLDNWQITKDVVNILYQLSVAVATTYNATK